MSTRRSLLQAVALSPLAALLPRGALAAPAGSAPRVVVVGAGAFGGWTAFHLAWQGARVTVVDAWGPGNPRASSGGDSRVIRAIYGADRLYTEMVRRSFELWAAIEPGGGPPLYTETGALWMFRDDDGYARAALPVLEELDFPIERPSLSAAARRWPQIDFAGVAGVYFEPRAGILAARRACLEVAGRAREAGADDRLGRVEPPVPAGGRLSSVRLASGESLEADAFVFACGPWLGGLFPDAVGDAVLSTRQEVFFLGPPAGSTDWSAGRLPVWIDFGERVFYGLPQSTAAGGVKFADDTRGPRFDPTSGDRSPSAAGLAAVRALVAERFPALAGAPLVGAKVCQYENSPDGHLIVDRHPEAGNCWLVGGGSGHGFKLSPALGETVAELVLGDGEPPDRFRLEHRRGPGGRVTQFDGAAAGL